MKVRRKVLAVSLPPDLIEWLRGVSARSNKPVSRIVEEMVKLARSKE